MDEVPMIIYNKLVRDKIPEIINREGKSFRIKSLEDQEYSNELKKKFQEEVMEYLKAISNEEALEELADVLEIIHSLALLHEGDIEKVETIRKSKVASRGGFNKRILLLTVEE